MQAVFAFRTTFVVLRSTAAIPTTNWEPNLPPAAQWRKLVLQIRPRKPTRPRRNQNSRQQINYFHCDQIGIPTLPPAEPVR